MGALVALVTVSSALMVGGERAEAGSGTIAIAAALAPNPSITSQVSVGPGGLQANSSSRLPSTSPDGRFVAFSSWATNLVNASDTNGNEDVFLRDRREGSVYLISVSLSGRTGNRISYVPAVSADGNHVAFVSQASDLVDGDTNGFADIFVRDRTTNVTTRISRSATGGPANRDSALPSISSDGRFVAFLSHASNIVDSDTNGRGDVFVHDRSNGSTTLVSRNSAGQIADQGAARLSISGDGRYVVFDSGSSNLVPGVGGFQVYLRDIWNGTTTLVSRSSQGTPGNSGSNGGAISRDGRSIAFVSSSSNLAPDFNGFADVFVHDVMAGTTELVSRTDTGQQVFGRHAEWPAISGDGRFVAFVSLGAFVSDDTNSLIDVFVRDRATSRTRRGSVTSTGGQMTQYGIFTEPIQVTDQGAVLFATLAALVPEDTSLTLDIYVNELAANTVPIVDAGPDRTLFAGEHLQTNGTFADPDAAQTWSGTIDYGDGSGTAPLLLMADKSFRLEHRYARPGAYVVVVTLTDSAGGSAQDHLFVTVKRRPLLYIPGIFGSELDWGQEGICQRPVWFNTCQALAVGEENFFDVLRFEVSDGTVRPTRPEITTNGRLVSGPGGGPYDDVQPYFEGAGYVYGANFSILTYDWRSSVTSFRDRLDVEIRGLRQRTGAPKVDLVAHSLGGLIVRSFLVSGSERANVANAVLLGSPELGTPLFMEALLGGICLPLGIDQCILSGDEVRDVARTIPSGVELSPSREYYALFPSADGDDHPVPYVDLRSGDRHADRDALIAREAEAGVLAPLIPAAEGFHANDATWLSSIPAGVQLTLIAGSGWNTVGQIVEQTTYFQLGPLKFVTGTSTDARFIDGDAVVVTESAVMLTGGATPPNVRRIYAGWQHVGLTTRGALPIALDVLDGADPVTEGRAYDHPLRPTGVIVSVHSPAELVVETATGDRIGSLDGSNFDSGMQNATYGRLADTKYASVPAGAPYAVTLAGTGDGEAKIKVRRVVDGVVVGTSVFTHVPVRAGSRGTFGIDLGGRPSELEVDLDGDGTVDTRLAATALDGPSAGDLAPPSVTIVGPKEGQAVVGAFDLDWRATDPLSGVARSVAVIDRDGSAPLAVERPGPIELAPGAHSLDVFADDRAGNVGAAHRQIDAMSYRWLVPLARAGELEAAVGRTIPVRFAVRRADGTLVEDQSVVVDLIDDGGAAVVGPLRYERTPAAGVFVRAGTYQADLTTRGLAAGVYRLRVRFDSAALTGEFALRVVLR